ncbi:MAG: hypothetical protein GX613_05320 [Chloroflexi bacterium]|nr:hypothetical protein [Chloroflexota bacterium]
MVNKQRWSVAPVLLVLTALLAAGAACALNSPDRLNEGRGTRDNPVPARVFAKTTQYDVRALSVLRPLPLETETPSEEQTDLSYEYMKVQFEVRCTRDAEAICNLTELRDNFQLVGGEGVLFPPDYTLEIDDPLLEGEILGGGEKAGWLVYRVPHGLAVTEAVVQYGEDLRVFFRLP